MKKVILGLFLICIISPLAALDGTKQATLYLPGLASVKSSPDASLMGLSFDFNHQLLLFGAEFLFIPRYSHPLIESSLYSNVDFLIGIQKKFNRFDISLCSGVGLNWRNDSEVDALDINNSDEDAYLLPGLPIRLRMDYHLFEQISLGFTGYVSMNKEVFIEAGSVSIGYIF